jgi:hypothetical protein
VLQPCSSLLLQGRGSNIIISGFESPPAEGRGGGDDNGGSRCGPGWPSVEQGSGIQLIPGDHRHLLLLLRHSHWRPRVCPLDHHHCECRVHPCLQVIEPCSLQCLQIQWLTFYLCLITHFIENTSSNKCNYNHV